MDRRTVGLGIGGSVLLCLFGVASAAEADENTLSVLVSRAQPAALAHSEARSGSAMASTALGFLALGTGTVVAAQRRRGLPDGADELPDSEREFLGELDSK